MLPQQSPTALVCHDLLRNLHLKWQGRHWLETLIQQSLPPPRLFLWTFHRVRQQMIIVNQSKTKLNARTSAQKLGSLRSESKIVRNAYHHHISQDTS
jgi:hypothetical protein